MALPSQPLPLPARMVPDPMSLGIISPNLGASGATTRLDTAAFVGADEAQASIGQGIAKFGSALDQIAVKKNNADTITAQYKAAEAMEQTQADIATEVANEPDQSKWQGIAAEHLGRLSQTLDGIPNVPPDAKEGINHKLTMFTTDTYGGLSVHAAKKSEADAVDSVHAIADRAGRTGDLPLGVGAIDGAVAHGLITPERGEDMKQILGQNVEKTKERQQLESGMAAIQADPEKAKAIFDDPKFNVSPAVRAQLKHEAHAAIGQQKQATMDGIMSKVDSGEFVVPEQIDEEMKRDPKITEIQAMHAKNALAEVNNKSKQQWNTENSSLITSGLMSAIRSYDPKNDPDLKIYDAITARITSDSVTGDRDELRKALSTARSGKAVAEKDPLMQNTVKTLNSMYERGELGQWFDKKYTPTEVTNPDGSISYFHPRETVINRTAQAQAKDLQVKIEASVRDFVKKNPKATNEDVLNEIHRVTPDYIAARSAASMGVPKQGPVPDDQTHPGSSGPEDILRSVPQYPGRIPKAAQAEDGPAQKPAAPAVTVADDSTETGIHVAAGAVPVESLKSSLPAGLKPHAQDFKDAADETGLDPRFLAAVSMFETGNGTSPAFRNKNNAMGISDAHGPTSQSSVRDSIFRQARTLANPKGPYRNAKTVEQVAAIYSPPGAGNDPNKTNGEWPEAVKRNLKRLKGHS